jgi:hypothetical protein
VDVSLILESLGEKQTRVGEWVNLIGYITQSSTQVKSLRATGEVAVQALLLWSAGPMNLQRYEQSLVKQGETIPIQQAEPATS